MGYNRTALAPRGYYPALSLHVRILLQEARLPTLPEQSNSVKRTFRLRKSTDFKRVRQRGKSYAHPLAVLITLPNDLPLARIGISAGRSVGNAVYRNRAKRRLRAIASTLFPYITPGWDIVLLARKNIHHADHATLHNALVHLFHRAGLLTMPEETLFISKDSR
ncbi:MAG: ribonuclease P protein component [Anaerolineae bacterium]|nr:MAG: ribonuclease P protein component [Anaerolineae bacterium]